MNKNKILDWIKFWKLRGYLDDIPDEAPEIFEKENMVPSYRRICLAIMKNDVQLQSLGFSRTKCHFYNKIKRSELIANGKIKIKEKQMVLKNERL